MAPISPGLTAIPAIVVLAAIFGRMIALVAREVRLIIVARLALVGTQPYERPDILKALASAQPDGRTSAIRVVDSANDEANQ